MYSINDHALGESGVVIEDILHMSDNELIQFASETHHKLYEEYAALDRKVFEIADYQEMSDFMYDVFSDYYSEDYTEVYEAYIHN